MYEINGDLEEMRELTKGIAAAEPALKRATVSALNKTIVSTRAYAVKLITGDYRVKAKAVRRELIIARANFRRMVARIVGEGSPGIPLYQFYPTPKRVPSTIHKQGRWLIKDKAMVPGSDKYLPRGGVKVMVTKGQRKMVRGAFLARMPSGHVGLFRRKEEGTGNWWDAFSGKQKIEELYGPSPLRLLDQDRYQEPVDDFAGDELDKNMLHEATFYLKKFKVIPDA